MVRFTTSNVDRIKYNGVHDYVATGEYRDTSMRLRRVDATGSTPEFIWFNNNITLEQYVAARANYAFDRAWTGLNPRGNADAGFYVPTGRTMFANGTTFRELMR